MRERYASILHLNSIRLADSDGRRAIAGANARIRAIVGVDVVCLHDHVLIDLQPAVTVSLITAELVSNFGRHTCTGDLSATIWVRPGSMSRTGIHLEARKHTERYPY